VDETPSKGSRVVAVRTSQDQLSPTPLRPKENTHFGYSLVTGQVPARDWLVPLLGLADEHDGGELPIEHSIYM
jgi:hypothetical protein